MTDQTDKDTLEAMRHLTREIEKLNSHRFIAIQNSPRRMILFQFGRGLAFGLGSVLGATLLVSLITWWLAQFEFLPIIGDWMAVLADEFERATGSAGGSSSDINQSTQ